MSTLIFGGTGQLGKALQDTCRIRDGVIALSSAVDVRDGDAVFDIVKRSKPDRIINTACGFFADQAEMTGNRVEASDISVLGAANVTRAAQEFNLPVMYVSSDFVFSGAKDGLYYEDCLTGMACNHYGMYKQIGEKVTLDYYGNSWVVRLASLFGPYGRRGEHGGFIDAVIHNALENRSMSVRADLLMSPTYSRDAAETMMDLFNHDPGIYHISNSGSTTWHGLATFVYRYLGSKGFVYTRKQPFFDAARRPKNSSMGSRFDYTQKSSWENAVIRYLRSKGLYLHNQEHNFAVVG